MLATEFVDCEKKLLASMCNLKSASATIHVLLLTEMYS